MKKNCKIAIWRKFANFCSDQLCEMLKNPMFAFVCKFHSFCTGSQTAQGNFLWKKKGVQGGYLTLKFNDKVKIFETAVVISLLKWNFWSPISPNRLIFFSKFFNSRRPCVCSMHHKNFSSFGGGRIFAPPPPPPQNGGFAVSGGSQIFFFTKLWGSIFFEG